jgi:hypothetical protein
MVSMSYSERTLFHSSCSVTVTVVEIVRDLRFLTAVNIKITVFWSVASCILVDGYQHFGETLYLCHHGRKSGPENEGYRDSLKRRCLSTTRRHISEERILEVYSGCHSC